MILLVAFLPVRDDCGRNIMEAFLIFNAICVCQFTKALLQGDRLLHNWQSGWHAGIDVTLARNEMPTSKHRLCQMLTALCFVASICFCCQ